MKATPYFFVVCQTGAESALKAALCQPNSPFRLAFSRPGFLTLKSDLSLPPWTKALPAHPLVRTCGQALQPIVAETAQELASKLLNLVSDLEFDHIHVWERDTLLPGTHGFEPGVSPLAQAVAEILQHHLKDRLRLASLSINEIAPHESRVLDLIRIDGRQWWLGMHRVTNIEGAWPGGVYPILPPSMMISRAYLKIAEAIAWSKLPFQIGDEIVEIGSSPGGASQFLLDIGLKVTGIDPAEMDPRILDQPNFRFVRARSRDLKRRFFSRFRWLVCDANVAPSYTLDAVQDIVTHPSNRIEGVILTIKLSSWKQVQEIPTVLSRLQSWNFPSPCARQLSFNRREYCLAAVRR